MNSANISFSDVWFTYPGSTVPTIKGLKLNISLGMCTVLVGPTGSGKSTILRILRGFHKLYGGELRGSIEMCGFDYDQLGFDDITSMGVIFMHQNPHANVHLLSVRNEVQSGLVYNNFPWQDSIEIVNRIEESLGVSFLKDRCTEQLSEGELQKVGIAASLATIRGFKRPPILLLDSPMSFLDGRSQDDLTEILKGLKEQNSTVLITCSDLHPYEEISDKVILIANGRSIEEGTVKTIMNCYEYAQLVGPPLIDDLNFLRTIYIRKKSKEILQDTNTTQDHAFIFENLWFAYNDRFVFNNISGKIGRPGTISAIFGHNGSGKTTLLKLLLGILKPKEGSVLLFRKSPDSYQPCKIGRKVAFVTQDPTEMFVSNTVEEECQVAPRSLHLDNPDALVSKALTLTRIDHLARHSVDSLSSGERRLLSLACTALVTNCDLVVLEEPDFALDPKRWKEVLRILLKFKRLGKTVILTTHAVETAIICDEVLVLSRGNIAFKGTPQELMHKESMCEELGASQVNRLIKANNRLRANHTDSFMCE